MSMNPLSMNPLSKNPLFKNLSSKNPAFSPFCFSLDRENFSGEFATREQARDAGLAAALLSNSVVDAVYVAKRQPVDPQGDHHADRIVADMRERMRIKFAQENFLDDVNEQQLADLDAAVEYAIAHWLNRHQLGPAPRLVSLSEYPVTHPNHLSPARLDKPAGLEVTAEEVTEQGQEIES